jgi:hypothetical protein
MPGLFLPEAIGPLPPSVPGVILRHSRAMLRPFAGEEAGAVGSGGNAFAVRSAEVDKRKFRAVQPRPISLNSVLLEEA